MKLSDSLKSQIKDAVVGMSLVDWNIPEEELDSYANRVVWWVENGHLYE